MVCRPDSLLAMLGSAASARKPEAHGSSSLAAIEGLPEVVKHELQAGMVARRFPGRREVGRTSKLRRVGDPAGIHA